MAPILPGARPNDVPRVGGVAYYCAIAAFLDRVDRAD